MLAALGGLLWGQEKPATNQLYGDTRSTQVPKPPSITDTQKAAAWKAQAIFLLAEAELKATAQYKEWENAQAELTKASAALCTEGFVAKWSKEDIACVAKPAPVKPEPVK